MSEENSTTMNDPALYRRLSQPFESEDAANAAISAFVADLRKIREKHGLPDIYCIIAGSLIQNEEEGDFIVSTQHGDSLKAERLTAWALGREQSRRQSMVGSLLRGTLNSPKNGR